MPTRRLVRRLAPALALPLALTVPALAAAPSTAATALRAPADAGGDSSLLLMLDASGSMKKKDPSGLTKIEAAKKALTSVVEALPDGSDVGLRVYGATVDSKGKPTRAACADTQLVTPVGPLDRPALTTAIARFRAVGETPIAHSLEQALGDLPETGKRTVVMVSDGQESCVPDPCPVVEKLVGSGVDLRIDTVGFAVDTKARKQLQCIARAGGGTYYDASDSDELTSNLSRISIRAARSFTTAGTRVTGSLGTDQGAPTIGPGQYVDTFRTGEGTRHYVLQRTIPGSTLHVSVSARPKVDLEGGYNQATIRFRAIGPDGGWCRDGDAMANRIGLSRYFWVITGSLLVRGDGDCGPPLQIPLEISRDEGDEDPVDAEILVIEEPPVTDQDMLPGISEPSTDPSIGPVGEPRPVVGGTRFADATPITPGTWSETLVSGETIFYRFPLDWGQAAKVVVGPVVRTTDEEDSPEFTALLYDPTRAQVPDFDPPIPGRDTTVEPSLVRQTAPVRYNNRDEFPVRTASLAGQYYLALALPIEDEPAGPVAVTFRLEVDGEVSGVPAYVGAAPSSAATASPASPTSSSSAGPAASRATDEATTDGTAAWRWLAGGGALAVLLALGTGVVLRRRGAATR